MSELDRFFRSRTEGERVIGTYLYPVCLLGEPDWADPYSATEVIGTVTVDSKDILISRMSGLFIRPPEELSNPYQEAADTAPADDVQAKLDFEEQAAQAFNTVICEFCLLGVVSQPTSPVHISHAQLIDQHILITGGGGGREYYGDRSSVPALDLLQARWLAWRTQPESIVIEALPLRRAGALAHISETLPEFVAGAYSLYSQRQINEALSDGWVVCEQLINHLWKQYLATLAGKRRKRLADERTYTVAVRLEVLRTVGMISGALYDALNMARDHRNKLMHHAENSLAWTSDGMAAMKMIIEHIVGEEVAAPEVLRGVNW